MRRLLLTLLLLLAALPPARAAGADDLLEPDKAFRFSARALDARTVEVRYGIADGYYLYRERFRFAAEPASVTLGQPQFPKGQIHEDKFLGKQETYRKEVRIRLPVEAVGAERMKLQVTSQGCADLGVCYVPQVQSADLRLASLGGSRSSIFKENEPFTSSPERVTAASEDVRFAGVLESGRLWLVMAVFFGAGLLLTFTPCVLPMIPILSGIIVGEGRKVTRRRAALVSIAYVLGMAVTYTAIGIGAAFSGNLFSAALQNAWVLGAFAAVFVGLALSMFGLYELRLPSSWQMRLTAASNRLGGGDWGAVVLMGVLSAAIVSPCVAAPLAGALLYIGQTRDVLLGGTALFSKAVGILALLAGAAQGIGALSGARDPLRPLAGLFAQSPEASLRFETVRTLADLDARLKTADKAVMLDFYADWCVSCKEMERFTFSDPRVQARLAGMTLLRADVTANNAEDKVLLKRYRLFGPPGIVFFDASGREIEGLRVIGYQSPEKFIKSLDQAARY